MGRRLSIAVVSGGASIEAEVSRASARAVATALSEAGHHVTRLELDVWLAETLRTGGFDVVFPVAHGTLGEDGSLQGLLELLDLPYVGSGVLASALAMDKSMARKIFGLERLPVAPGVIARRPDGATEPEIAAAALEAVARARAEVGLRLVVKPSSQGSGVGVARFPEDAPAEEIAAAVTATWTLDEVLLLEHFARGREVTCGVLEDGAGLPVALPPTEIASPRDAFYTFEARYAPGRSVHTCPADLGDPLTMAVQAISVAAHRALGCRDLSRADLIVGDDGSTDAITLLEVNTMPGFTETSLFPQAAGRAGISLARLCDSLVRNASVRGPARRLTARALPRA